MHRGGVRIGGVLTRTGTGRGYFPSPGLLPFTWATSLHLGYFPSPGLLPFTWATSLHLGYFSRHLGYFPSRGLLPFTWATSLHAFLARHACAPSRNLRIPSFIKHHATLLRAYTNNPIKLFSNNQAERGGRGGNFRHGATGEDRREQGCKSTSASML
ncbi:unnamed protein product [Closterium sp. Yama58-4]|nr:unnamed protein product [Closterium sp. Yama58-4]